MTRVEKLSDSWRTPDWLFEKLNKEFNFDIDLCAIEENSKCEVYCADYLNDLVRLPDSISNHCLQNYLDGDFTCFMNPPYSNPKPFIEKAWEDSKHCKIVCLVKCDPSTKWWATFWNYDDVFDLVYDEQGIIEDAFLKEKKGPKPGCEVRFFPKRIKFDPPEGFLGKVGGPSFSSALLIFDRRGYENINR